MHCPFDYSLCNQTVTIYRKQRHNVLYQVIENCYLEYSTRVDTDEYGKQMERRFLLIIPGSRQQVFVDDRIYDGVGPELSIQEWTDFIPAKVPGLMQVQYVTPCSWNGQICHMEAGRKGSMFSY